MSEKTLWNFMKKKGIRGVRLENCSCKGIPDLITVYNKKTCFIELKDWTKKPLHPLSAEQHAFLKVYNGVVLIQMSENIHVCEPSKVLVSPSDGDIESWLVRNSYSMKKSELNGESLFWATVAICGD